MSSTNRSIDNQLGQSHIANDQEDQDNGFEDERIDYTNALLRERKKSQEILSKLNASQGELGSNKVQIGFAQHVNDDHFKQMDTKTQNQLVFDVLPSFEMYHAFQFTSSTENSNVEPPDYFNTQESCESESFMTMNDETSSHATTPANTSFHSIPSSSPLFEDIGRNIIDKSHTLPHIDTDNLQVSVHVTKDVPLYPNIKYEMESMLKEYTSGDVVHGYVVVDNVSDKPIQFQMFHVTLEGYITIIDKENKKQFIKRFLTMVDMSASWSPGCVSPTANISFEPLSKDQDGFILGLRNDRIIAPHTKHKKFFAFKFPYNLLDNVCRHQQEVHTLLPPSLGVDILKNKGKFSEIELNPVLNYGHLGTRGSPVLTKDLSQRKLCVSYSINAKLIGASPKNPTTLSVLKEDEYALRFIPFGFAVPLFSSKKTLDTMSESIEHGFEMAKRVLKLNVEGNADEVQKFDLEIKTRQLKVSSIDYSGSANQSFPLRNKHFGGSDFSKVEAQLTYLEGKSKFLNMLKNGQRKASLNVTKSGLITVSAKIPKDGLPYRSPSLLRKTNEVSKLSEIGLKNYDTLSSSLSMNEKQKLTFLKLHLNFIPSDNSLEVIPPSIKFVKASLIVFNIYSPSPIPIKLSQDLFLKEKDLQRLKAKFQNYHETFTDLQAKFKSNSIDINSYLDKSILQDIKSMKDLQVDKFSIQAFDYSIDESTWESSHGSWERDVNLSLSFKEKITETLIPNFQSCVLSRVYSIGVEIGFKNGQTSELFVPIRIRKFDDL